MMVLDDQHIDWHSLVELFDNTWHAHFLQRKWTALKLTVEESDRMNHQGRSIQLLFTPLIAAFRNCGYTSSKSPLADGQRQ
jgi:hypothetical protein